MGKMKSVLIIHSKLVMWSMRGLLGLQEMPGQLGLTAAFRDSESQQYTQSLCAHMHADAQGEV